MFNGNQTYGLQISNADSYEHDPNILENNAMLTHAKVSNDASSPLKHSRIDRHHDDKTRDDECEGHEGDQENGAPAGREFAADDPVLLISANLLLFMASGPNVPLDHRSHVPTLPQIHIVDRIYRSVQGEHT